MYVVQSDGHSVKCSLEAIFYENNRPIDDRLTLAPTYWSQTMC